MNMNLPNLPQIKIESNCPGWKAVILLDKLQLLEKMYIPRIVTVRYVQWSVVLPVKYKTEHILQC